MQPNQLKFLRFVGVIVLVQFFISAMLFIIDSTVGLSVGAAAASYSLAFTSYGLLYFRQRGAAAAAKMVGALVYGVLLKYAIVVGLAWLCLAYQLVQPLPFFSSLLLNHLIYIGVSTFYKGWR